jgi:hypothetical protein
VNSAGRVRRARREERGERREENRREKKSGVRRMRNDERTDWEVIEGLVGSNGRRYNSRRSLINTCAHCGSLHNQLYTIDEKIQGYR